MLPHVIVVPIRSTVFDGGGVRSLDGYKTGSTGPNTGSPLVGRAREGCVGVLLGTKWPQEFQAGVLRAILQLTQLLSLFRTV